MHQLRDPLGVLTRANATTVSVSGLRWVLLDLTPRQYSLLRRVSEGWTNQQIARRMGLAEGTVRTHLNNIYARLGVRSRTEAVTRGFGHSRHAESARATAAVSPAWLTSVTPGSQFCSDRCHSGTQSRLRAAADAWPHASLVAWAASAFDRDLPLERFRLRARCPGKCVPVKGRAAARPLSRRPTGAGQFRTCVASLMVTDIGDDARWNVSAADVGTVLGIPALPKRAARGAPEKCR